MTLAAPSPVTSLPSAAPRGRGERLTELLLVGAASPLLVPLAWWARTAFGLPAAELAVGFVTFHAAHVVNDPHFAVTYLLFYRDVRGRALGPTFSGAQRARYLIAGFLVPVVLAAWAIVGLAERSPRLLGGLVQLMFLLVGWHYVKQGFGVLSVLSARRGFSYSGAERGALLAHCYAAWAYAWASPSDPGTVMEERGVIFTSIAHGPWLERVTFVGFVATAVVALAVVVRRHARTRVRAPLAPLATFVATVWLWTVYTRVERLMVYVVPALHSLQYLYFVWLLRRPAASVDEDSLAVGVSPRARVALLFVSAVGLGWVVFHGGPGLLDAALFAPRRHSDPGNLGATPVAAACFACVNVHHYFMDTVIWRRDNVETRALLRA